MILRVHYYAVVFCELIHSTQQIQYLIIITYLPLLPSVPGPGSPWLDPVHPGRLPAGAAVGGLLQPGQQGRGGRPEGGEGRPQAQEASHVEPGGQEGLKLSSQSVTQ